MPGTFVIGDIHGAFKALLQTMVRAEIQENDRLIFLGDLVDGWSQSFEVIQYLADLEKKMTCIFIRGNHDLLCQQWLENEMHDVTWVFNEGRATVKSYQHQTDADKSVHLQFFRRMQDFYIDENHNLFIHAGFSSLRGPGHERDTNNYNKDRTLWEMALCMDKGLKKDSLFYPKRLKLFSEIFIGHTPTLRYNCFEPMNAANVWNLDTGVAFNGRLSILDVQSKAFWQSDLVQDLYPGESGRTRN